MTQWYNQRVAPLGHVLQPSTPSLRGGVPDDEAMTECDLPFMRRLLASLILLFSLGLPAIAFSAAPEDAPEYTPSATAGLKETAETAGAYKEEQKSVVEITGTVINAVLATIGIVFVLLMVYAGILYLTAMGEAEKVEKAKSLMVNALIGIVIVAAAYAMVSFLISELILAGTPGAQEQRQAQTIQETCTTPDACANNPLCKGSAQCKELEEEYGESAAERLCEGTEDKPYPSLCCAIWEETDPRYEVLCTR